jgi:hypothetical protein
MDDADTDDNLTMVLNKVNANDGEFTSIGSIFSMNGMINGKPINIEDKDGIKKNDFTTKLTEALKPVDNEAVDDEVVDPKIAEKAALEKAVEDANAAKKTKIDADANADTTDEDNAIAAAELALETFKTANAALFKGGRKSRKAKRTKKGGKKRRNTLRRHRKSR